MLARANVLRALEHHVFEKVSETCAPFPLVPRSDFIADGDGIDRRVMIFRDDDPQPIFERGVGELQRRDFGGGLLGRHEARRPDQNRKWWFERDLLTF